MKTEAEKLRNARALIEKGWTQGLLARNKDGEGAFSDATEAVSFCAVGACVRSGVSCGHLKKLLGVDTTSWNDTPGRTKEEVLDLFDRAIALAESKGE